VLEGQDLSLEGLDVLDRGRRGADYVAEAQVDGVDVGEVQRSDVACDGPVDGLALDLDALDGGGFAGGHREDRVADLERAGVQAPGDGERVHDAASKDVGNGEAEGEGEGAFGGLRGVERFDEGGACVPVSGYGAFRGRPDDVVSNKASTGDESQILGGK